jgi:UDP-N-acetylmuramoyl-tripeptide--D-alanyl-D-alanine ligase
VASRSILLELAELENIPGAKLLDFSGGGVRGVSGVCIDSRLAGEGSLFVALPGARQDGHTFAQEAFDRGAAVVMVEEAKLQDSALGLEGLAKQRGRVLLVLPAALRGLQDAARLYLKKFPRLLKMAVSGSAGKSSVKEIAAAIIGREKETVYNPGNLNSETGLPLAVFEVRSHHEAGIFEMGMNRRGEIEELAAVLEPCVALITNIGSAHIGILGSREGIAKEKKNIFSRFSGTETALVPADDEFRDFLAEGVRGTVKFYGPSSFAEWEGVRDLGLGGSEIRWAGEWARFRLPGKHNLKNALAAIALAREAGASDVAIRQGLESVWPLFGRSEIVEGPVTVIRDCYNASPESTAEALAFCDSLDWPGRKIYVLASMLELGDHAGAAHEQIGRALAASAADRVFLLGEEMGAAAEVLRQAGTRDYSFAADMKELAGALEAYIRPGDLVLLKGSRGKALEGLSGLLAAIREPAVQESGEIFAGKGVVHVS